MLLIGIPLAIVGVLLEALPAVVLLALMGIGIAIVDVTGLTIVQRAVPENVLARVFGVLQLLVELDRDRRGDRAAAHRLARHRGRPHRHRRIPRAARPPALAARGEDRRGRDPAESHELRILGSIPIFSPLPGMTLEHLATRLVPLRLDPGTMIVRKGDAGDRFYIVVEGTVEISEDGAAIGTLEPGDYFGEIALLRDVPRTATVTAATSVVLYALDREDFLATVTGHPLSAEAAETVVAARLAGPASSPVRPPAA